MATRFAKVADAHVAYRTWGEGPLDMLYFEEIPVDMLDDEPRLAAALNRLASIGRVISFNPRGLGLSDPLGRRGAPTMDERLEDAVAVLDAVDCERTIPLGFSFLGHTAIDFAARRHDRTRALVLCNARARWVWAEDYPDGFPVEFYETTAHRFVDPEAAEPPPFDPAPSASGDPAFVGAVISASGPASTPVRSRSSATMSPASAGTSPLACSRRPTRARCGCPGRSSISSPARGSASKSAGTTSSRASREGGHCSPFRSRRLT